MWLTSWWVAWLLNFYGFSHTNCMVFYRTPWTRYGIPWNPIGTSGNLMAFHGIPWTSKETPGNLMAFHGTPSLLYGTPCNSMAFHGYSMELHGIPWNSMDTKNSMDYHGFPWNSKEVFHTGIAWSAICSSNRTRWVRVRLLPSKPYLSSSNISVSSS